MTALMQFISREYDGVRPAKRAEEMVEQLRRFHTELAERLHNGQDVLDMIPE